MLRKIIYWCVFTGLFALGTNQFLVSFNDEQPQLLPNAILPVLALSVLIAMLVKGTLSRYYSASVSILLAALACVVAFVFAVPGSVIFLIPVTIILLAIGIDMLLSQGAKAFFSR